MQGIIPFILIILALAVIIVIIVRKFPQLLLLDVDTIPEVKESKKKNEFLRKRAEAQSKKMLKRLSAAMEPVMQKLKAWQLEFRKYVGAIERKALARSRRRLRLETPEKRVEKRLQVQNLVQEATHALDSEEYDAAEERYIAAIKKDSKNKEAYQGLAHVYYKQGQIVEAQETYQFVLQLDPRNEEALIRLAEIAEQEGKLEKAVDYYQQAVLVNDSVSLLFAKLFDLLFQLGQYPIALEAIQQALQLEPQNPKYLDNFTEVSILLGDKEMAEEGYGQLRMVNPENQKLLSFRQRIDELTIL